MTFSLTAHLLVRNEERFIWYALASVINFVDQLLIFDTGSQDKTVSLIQSFLSSKIIFEKKGAADRGKLARLRQEQLDRTKTDWILIVDGDEIYPQKTINEVISLVAAAPQTILGLVIPFYNFAGDIYHVQKETKGRYQIGSRRGHLNLRGLRFHRDLKVVGRYPLEGYRLNGKLLQDQPEKLLFASQRFFHAGGLVRSHLDKNTLERQPILDQGVSRPIPLPEVFRHSPKNIPPVFQKRSLVYKIASRAKSIIRP